MHPAPRDWLYFETPIEDGKPDQLIVWACSRECAAALWNEGPGPRWTLEELDALPHDPVEETVRLRTALQALVDAHHFTDTAYAHEFRDALEAARKALAGKVVA